MLPFEIRAGIARVAASGDGRDERDQRIARDRLHQADVLMAEGPEYDGRAVDDRHLVGQHPGHQRCLARVRWLRPDVKTSGGGAGEGSAPASVIGFAPAANRRRSSPWTSRPGNGSPAALRVSSATGRPGSAAGSTRL